MQPITAGDAVRACRGELVAGDLNARITGVSTDTRTLEPGDLFVALTGENSDGHKFLADALTRGASGVVAANSGQRPRGPARAEGRKVVRRL